MADIEQFIPADGTDGITQTQFEEAFGEEASEKFWPPFLAMKRRVEFPRRRGDRLTVRAGPVLFHPCQYLERDDD